MEPYMSGQLGFIDNQDRQFGNGTVWTLSQTRNHSPEPLLTICIQDVMNYTFRTRHEMHSTREISYRFERTDYIREMSRNVH